MSIPEVIGELVERYGSINAASRKVDIPVTTLFRMYNGERVNPTLETLRKVAAGLNRPLYKIIRELEKGTGTVVVSSR